VIGDDIVNLGKVKFRIANEDDIEDIMKIEKSSFSLEICEKRDVFLERMQVFPQGFFIMEYDRKVIGYLTSEIWEYKSCIDEKYFMLDHSIKEVHNINGTELYISSMGILPDFRGKELGKLMFQNFSDYILTINKNLKTKILIVCESWKNARKIYISNDFKEILVLKDFFKSNKQKPYSESGIVMRKYL